MKRYCLATHPEGPKELPENGRALFCDQCRAMFNYHARKGAANFNRYKGRLQLANSRVEVMPERPTKNSVRKALKDLEDSRRGQASTH